MPSILDTSVRARIGRSLRAIVREADGVYDKYLRVDPAGSQIMRPVPPTRHQQQDEGSYIYASTGIVTSTETALSMPVTTAFLNTNSTIYIYNNDPNYSLALDYFKFVITVPPASTTVTRFLGVLDQGQKTFTTDNSVALVPRVNPSYASPMVSPIIKLQNGGAAQSVVSPTATAQTTAFEATKCAIGGLPVLGDEIRINFGTDGSSGRSAAGAGMNCSQAMPVIIPPGWNYNGQIFFLANAATGASFTFEMGMWVI